MRSTRPMAGLFCPRSSGIWLTPSASRFRADRSTVALYQHHMHLTTCSTDLRRVSGFASGYQIPKTAIVCDGILHLAVPRISRRNQTRARFQRRAVQGGCQGIARAPTKQRSSLPDLTVRLISSPKKHPTSASRLLSSCTNNTSLHDYLDRRPGRAMSTKTGSPSPELPAELLVLAFIYGETTLHKSVRPTRIFAALHVRFSIDSAPTANSASTSPAPPIPIHSPIALRVTRPGWMSPN